MGSSAVEWRRSQCERVRHLSRELQPVQERWRASLHPQVRKIIGNWHLPLLHVLAVEAGCPDLFFALDISLGLPTMGRAAHSFSMPLKATRASMSLSELHAQAAQRNQQLLSSIRTSGDEELDVASAAKTKAEVDSGVMLGPWPAGNLPAWVRTISRRFPIWECHGPSGQKKTPKH